MSKKKFTRQDKHKKKEIPDSWKKPVGTHNDSRLKKKDTPAMPNPGYRTPNEIRGLHPSGFEDVLVHRPEDLEELDSEEQAARIASKVGGRKRQAIVDKADDLGIHLLNRGDEE